MNVTQNVPRVSVVIPTYNRGDLIGETIRSLQEQDFEDFEVIIVDDGSTDNTKMLCEDVVSADPRFAYVAEDKKNRGPCYCRNKGYQLAQGEYLIFLDSDDVLLPNALRNRVKLMDASEERDFIVFIGEFFQRTPGDMKMLWNIPTSIDPLLRFIGDDVPWQTTGPIWRKTSFKKTGLWDENIIGCDDQELHTRTLSLGLSYEFTDKIDYAIRGAIDDRSQLGQILHTRRGIMSQVARIQNLCKAEINLCNRKLASTKKLMAGSLLFRCFQMIHFFDDKEAALKIWKLAREYRLICSKTSFLGSLCIKRNKSFWGDIAAYLINHKESDDFLLKNRANIGTIPTSCLEEKPYDGRFHRKDSFVRSPAVSKGLILYLVGKVKSKVSSAQS
jgi:glycosyltransferase involved in cell wall biosynthesis